jgi:hypothetical protein
LPAASVAIARTVVEELSETEIVIPGEPKAVEVPVAARFTGVQSEVVAAL